MRGRRSRKLQWGHDPKTVDGRMEPGPLEGLLQTLLQWGHDPKTVDGREHFPSEIFGNSLRFNGATIRRPWMVEALQATSRRWDASMGPRSEDRGWGGSDARRSSLPKASMGPRSEDRGWGACPSPPTHSTCCWLQWGHDPKTVDGWIRLVGITLTCCLSLQWGHDPKTVDGPTLVKNWIFNSIASMGPRSEDRGWLWRTEAAGHQGVGFNGATIRRPWMAFAGRRCRLQHALQWGHDPKTVDGTYWRIHPRLLAQASMGPRSEDRGWSRL